MSGILRISLPNFPVLSLWIAAASTTRIIRTWLAGLFSSGIRRSGHASASPARPLVNSPSRQVQPTNSRDLLRVHLRRRDVLCALAYAYLPPSIKRLILRHKPQEQQDNDLVRASCTGSELIWSGSLFPLLSEDLSCSLVVRHRPVTLPPTCDLTRPSFGRFGGHVFRSLPSSDVMSSTLALPPGLDSSHSIILHALVYVCG